MDWVLASLGAAVGFAAVTILDKIILVRHVASAWVFIFVAGFMQLPGALIPLAFVPFPGYAAGLWLAALASGAAFGLSLVLMFWTLRRQDASLVTAVYQTAPVFVAIMAVSFLAERLTALHWLAIVVTVGGAALISLRRRSGGGLPVLGGWFFVALGSSALFAAGAVLSKVALDGGMSLWNLYTIRSTTLAAAMLALAWRPSTVEHMAMLVRDRRGLSLFVFTEAGLAFASMYLTTLAIELGPVSLASTVMASRPMFVFLFGIVLSAGAVRVLSEPVDRASLAHRGLAIAMIVAGIAGVSLL